MRSLPVPEATVCLRHVLVAVGFRGIKEFSAEVADVFVADGAQEAVATRDLVIECTAVSARPEVLPHVGVVLVHDCN